MAVESDQAPGLFTLVGRLTRTAVGAVQNRFELLALEWQEERARLTELLVWIVALLFLGVMSAVLLTGVIIFLCPEDVRIYVAGAFTLVYVVMTFVAWFMIRGMLKREPYAESVEQARRDREWLKSFH